MFSSSVNIRRWAYVRYCQSAMTQKLFSTGPGTFRRAERKEATDGLDRTSCSCLCTNAEQFTKYLTSACTDALSGACYWSIQ